MPLAVKSISETTGHLVFSPNPNLMDMVELEQLYVSEPKYDQPDKLLFGHGDTERLALPDLTARKTTCCGYCQDKYICICSMDHDLPVALLVCVRHEQLHPIVIFLV
ncbi:hypothetical protein E2C01_059982 [Portunus trituberculatus]|uniref:Uncharacterized protein n=1 Tax=Portunus trituberculatus TaxID=210409 RepID=A0A5B7H7C3_PORTR|nr:hypothetical protein [Portunus trituberculatus]